MERPPQISTTYHRRTVYVVGWGPASTGHSEATGKIGGGGGIVGGVKLPSQVFLNQNRLFNMAFQFIMQITDGAVH